MASEQHPPLPNIVDGTYDPTMTANAFLYSETRVELSVQVGEDGGYRTSILRLGGNMRRLDIFAEREGVERLHRLLGQHLEQLDMYDRLLGRPSSRGGA